MIKKVFLIFIFLTAQAFSEEKSSVKTMEDLIRLIEKERIEQKKEFKEREARFRRLKNNQKNLLAKAQEELKKEEEIQKQLLVEFQENEKKLGALEQEKNEILGQLGEIFGAFKQSAGEFKGHISESLVSAQLKQRKAFINKITEQSKLPNIDELRRFWLELHREALELGRIRTFKDFIVLEDGSKKEVEVTRVGAFNLVSQGKYLSYFTETDQIMELSRQPQRRFLGYIKDLESEKSKNYLAIALDPSRGTLLSKLLTAPTLGERVSQGGFVGYFIILLFFIGFGISVYRYIVLRKEEQKLKTQLQSSDPDPENPIGKLRISFEENKAQSLEVIEIKLDEVITNSLPLFERGIGVIKMLAAVAPLCGLLGTVIGMIITFQSITLFGTGDPKVMAGGISQALVTTVLGLLCAIPLLFLHTFISSKSKALIQILEEQAAGLIAQKIEEKNHT